MSTSKEKRKRKNVSSLKRDIYIEDMYISYDHQGEKNEQNVRCTTRMKINQMKVNGRFFLLT